MTKRIWAAVAVVAAVLLAAPVVEMGTTGSTQYFAAVGMADSGGGE